MAKKRISENKRDNETPATDGENNGTQTPTEKEGEETPETEGDGESEEKSLNEKLDDALSASKSELGITNINAKPTTPDISTLTDNKIQSVINPILQFAGEVKVETAKKLSE